MRFKKNEQYFPITKIEKHIHNSLYFPIFGCLWKSEICRHDMMEVICGISISVLHCTFMSAEETSEIVLKEFKM